MRLFLVFILFATSRSKVVKPDEDGWHRIRETVDSDEFNFFILGDWGGWPAPLYQSTIQLSVAASMMRTAKIHKVTHVNFMFLLDNLYTVLSRWRHTIKKIYFSYLDAHWR